MASCVMSLTWSSVRLGRAFTTASWSSLSIFCLFVTGVLHLQRMCLIETEDLIRCGDVDNIPATNALLLLQVLSANVVVYSLRRNAPCACIVVDRHLRLQRGLVFSLVLLDELQEFIN